MRGGEKEKQEKRRRKEQEKEEGIRRREQEKEEGVRMKDEFIRKASKKEVRASEKAL